MKTNRIEVKASQIDRLLGDLRTVPDTPLGSCLTDEQFVDYMVGGLRADERERLDQHLGGCPTCAETLEHILEQHDTHDKIIAVDFAAAADSWAAFVREPGRKAAAAIAEARPIWQWRSPDGSAEAHAVLEANGDLTFRFTSINLRLAGRSVFVRCGTQRLATCLETVSDAEVGGKIIVRREQRPEQLTEISFEMS